MKARTIFDLVGNTPHLRMNRLYGPHSEVWIKLERQNPGGSIKDRIALAMIEEAEKNGKLKPGMYILEPTSGNTGIGLAWVAAVKGYRLVLVMPESMSLERRRLINIFGAEFILTPKEKGIKGAIEKATELAKADPNAWMPRQFDNPVNTRIHETTTVEEILRDFPDGFDAVVTGVGTGGHITAVGNILKKKFPKLKLFAVEPELSPVLSGGQPGPHPLQGIGPGFIPSILDTSLLDGVIQISKEEAYAFTLRAAREEGLFCGVSSGATLAAISKKLGELPNGSRVLGFNYDTGERYLSIEGLFP